jgi:hypothetical protein
MTNRSPFNFPGWLQVAVTGFLATLLVLALWRQGKELERIRTENDWLKAQALAAEQGARAERVARAVPLVEPDDPSPPTDAGRPPRAAAAPGLTEPMVMTPTGLAPPPRTTGLTLAGTHVMPIAGGLQATLQFHPTPDEPPGMVALVVRLPRDSASRILDLDTFGSAPLSEVSRRVSEDGKFAVFQATADTAAPIAFALSVSGAVTADVRGTTGIGPFDLEISPLQANAVPK